MTLVKLRRTGRSTRAQPFNWNGDGTPAFGSPVGTGTSLAVRSGELGPITAGGQRLAVTSTKDGGNA